MVKTTCAICGVDVGRFKDLKKLRKQRICKDCYNKNRIKFREETIEEFGIKKALDEMDKEIKRESKTPEKRKEYSRNRYRKKHGIPLDAPLMKIKGQKTHKPRHKYSSFITFQEKQQLFGLFIRRGFCYEEASERVKALEKFERELRTKFKEEDKIKEKLSKSKQEMLEELYRT